MSEDLERRAERSLRDMEQIIDGVSVEDIRANGMTIRMGGKLVKLEVASVETPSIEDEIRDELRGQLRQRLEMIKNSLNAKITEMVSFTSSIRAEFERKERQYKDKLRSVRAMPDVSMDHAQKGLSVVKGRNMDSLIWLVQGIYWPKFVDFKPIEPKYAKKLLTHIIIMIETSGENVTRVSTRKTIGLDYFEHYHQSSPDCWGKWKWKSRWGGNPNEIIDIAREAEAVLENVNTGSVANRTPRGLPRLDTLRRHVTNKSAGSPQSVNILNQAARRVGIGAGLRDRDEDEHMWTS